MSSILESLKQYLPTYIGSNPYLVSLSVVILSIVLAFLILFVFNRYLHRLAKRTKTKFDDLIFDATKKPIFTLVLLYGIQLGILNLTQNATIMRVFESLLAITFLLILLRTFDVTVNTWGDSVAKRTKTKLDETLLPLFHKTARVVFFIIGLLWVLKIWSIDIGPYLAGVGISGLVLGLALQDSLKNVFGGISMLLDKNFHLGDTVKLESGQFGNIESVGLRSTKVLTFDNELLFVPNGKLANMIIQNYHRPNTTIRKTVEFTVAYGTDVEKVKKVIAKAINKIKGLDDDPAPDVIFVEMGDSALKFKARFWTEWKSAYNKYLEVTDVIHTTLNKEGIEIPFPTQTVYLKK